MRSRKSFPAIFAQTIEREISALEAAGSLWRPGRDRSLELRSAGPGIMGYTVFRIMTGFPTLHSRLPLGGKYLCLALAAGAHWPRGPSSPSMCIPKAGPVKGDKQGYSLMFGLNLHSGSGRPWGGLILCLPPPPCALRVDNSGFCLTSKGCGGIDLSAWETRV